MTQPPATAARLLIVSGLLATLAVWTHARPASGGAASPDFDALPLAFGGWTGRPAPALAPEVAQVVAADQYVRRYYTGGGAAIEMDVAYYARPRAGAAMHSPLNCLPGNGWQVMGSRVVPISVHGRSVQVRHLVVGREGRRLAMTYWFHTRGGVIASEYEQRFRLFLDGVRGRPADAALVRVMTPLAEGAAGADAALLGFSTHLLGALERAFR